MAARKKITEVNITSSGQYSGNFSNHCPHESGSSKENSWFEFLLTELLRPQTGSEFKLPIDVTGNEYILVDRGEITGITITLS